MSNNQGPSHPYMDFFLHVIHICDTLCISRVQFLRLDKSHITRPISTNLNFFFFTFFLIMFLRIEMKKKKQQRYEKLFLIKI